MAINEIPQPGFSSTPTQRDKEILSSMIGLRQDGGTFAVDAAAGPDNDGILPSGTVLTRDEDGYFIEYADAGAGAALGVLRSALDVSTAIVPGNVVTAGRLKLDQLVGLTAAAIVDLNGRSDADANTFTF